MPPERNLAGWFEADLTPLCPPFPEKEGGKNSCKRGRERIPALHSGSPFRGCRGRLATV